MQLSEWPDCVSCPASGAYPSPTLSPILLLLLLGLVLWFWQDSLRARDIARMASTHACRISRLQLLDDTVALERIWLRRDEHGRLQIERIYIFEFTDTGNTRRRGSVTLLGHRVELVALEGSDLLIP